MALSMYGFRLVWLKRVLGHCGQTLLVSVIRAAFLRHGQQKEGRLILLVTSRLQRLRFRSMPRKSIAYGIFSPLLALLFLAPGHPLAAHDIPNDATVQIFFKPTGNHLNILVRVPLKTM